MKVEDFTDILYEKDDETGIVTVTLNTPKRKNAMSSLTFLELWWAVDMMENDDTARIMIMTGAKDPNNDDPKKQAFSSGGYFNPTALAGISDDLKKQISSELGMVYFLPRRSACSFPERIQTPMVLRLTPHKAAAWVAEKDFSAVFITARLF